MKKTMHAMQLKNVGHPLQDVQIPCPEPKDDEILIKIIVCGVCRTDLHVVDGELPQTQLPVIPGHQIVGTVIKKGKHVRHFSVGQRVGVPWLGSSCQQCDYCQHQQENLCDQACYTGCQINGGFAEYCVANADFCFALPDNYSDLEVAPLLCAGLIGYRAYKKTAEAKRIGIIGFGAAAHIITQVAVYQQKEVYAFTRPDDEVAMQFALELGAVWSGSSDDQAPCLLDAIIIFAAGGELIPKALQAVRKGGIVICAGIHMSAIPAFPYEILWGERTLCSIANLTRQDGYEFIALAPQIPIKTIVHAYPLSQINQALADLRHGSYTGAGVIYL